MLRTQGHVSSPHDFSLLPQALDFLNGVPHFFLKYFYSDHLTGPTSYLLHQAYFPHLLQTPHIVGSLTNGANWGNNLGPSQSGERSVFYISRANGRICGVKDESPTAT